MAIRITIECDRGGCRNKKSLPPRTDGFSFSSNRIILGDDWFIVPRGKGKRGMVLCATHYQEWLTKSERKQKEAEEEMLVGAG